MDTKEWAMLIGGCLVLFSAGLLGYEVFSYLKHGYWHSHTFIELAGMPSAHSHTEWVGAWNIVYVVLNWHASILPVVAAFFFFSYGDDY